MSDTNELVIGLDFGTSGVSAVLLSAGGTFGSAREVQFLGRQREMP
jgi:hypothetical protein